MPDKQVALRPIKIKVTLWLVLGTLIFGVPDLTLSLIWWEGWLRLSAKLAVPLGVFFAVGAGFYIGLSEGYDIRDSADSVQDEKI